MPHRSIKAAMRLKQLAGVAQELNRTHFLLWVLLLATLPDEAVNAAVKGKSMFV